MKQKRKQDEENTKERKKKTTQRTLLGKTICSVFDPVQHADEMKSDVAPAARHHQQQATDHGLQVMRVLLVAFGHP